MLWQCLDGKACLCRRAVVPLWNKIKLDYPDSLQAIEGDLESKYIDLFFSQDGIVCELVLKPKIFSVWEPTCWLMVPNPDFTLRERPTLTLVTTHAWWAELPAVSLSSRLFQVCCLWSHTILMIQFILFVGETAEQVRDVNFAGHNSGNIVLTTILAVIYVFTLFTEQVKYFSLKSNNLN